MQHKIETYIENKRLLSPKAKIIVGLSGGADSVALLHILHTLGYSCVAAHCNFQLRDKESTRDEQFVTQFAKQLNIPFYKICFETKKYAAEHKISIEMAARDLRYAWFEELRLKLEAEAIAVAHHADDNAETLLLNLIRGTGIRGLSGMSAQNDKIIRPFLDITRNDIENYLSQNKLKYVTDSSNMESDYNRNKIRNLVLPLLEEINPSVKQTLNENISRFDDVLAIYNEAILEKEKRIAHKDVDKTMINIQLLKQEVASKTVLYELIKDYGFHSDQIAAIIQSLESLSGKTFYSDKYRLVKDREFLIISKKETLNKEEYWIEKSQTETLEPIHLKLKLIKNTPTFKVSKQAHCVHLEADNLQFPLTIRHWQEGDFFVPFGMTGKKKLSDYFIDEKINIIDKENSFILLSNNKVVWIIGHRTDNRFKVSDKTENILEIEIISNLKKL